MVLQLSRELLGLVTSTRCCRSFVCNLQCVAVGTECARLVEVVSRSMRMVLVVRSRAYRSFNAKAGVIPHNFKATYA